MHPCDVMETGGQDTGGQGETELFLVETSTQSIWVNHLRLGAKLILLGNVITHSQEESVAATPLAGTRSKTTLI